MGLSDRIEMFIAELLKGESDDCVELRRNELASIFECVPSQINYVISTRFTPERGYVVESRRGGGGYVRIRRITPTNSELIERIGSSLTYDDAKCVIEYLHESGYINDQTAQLLAAALTDNSICIRNPERSIVRANILKNVISRIDAAKEE